MKNRLLAMLLCLGMLCATLSACGSSSTSTVSSSSASEAASDVVADADDDTGDADVAEASESVEASQTEAEADNTRATIPGSDSAELSYINEVSLPLCEETISLTMLTTAVNLTGDLETLGIEDFNDFEYAQYLEGITNVHLDVTGVNFFTASEQYNVYIAAGDYPDMIVNLGTYYSTGLSGAYADEIIIDLTDMLEEYAPNYSYLIHSNPDETIYYLTDGMSLEFMGTYESFINNQGLVVRSDWLDELGLEVPETYEDLHNVLLAFQEAYGCTTAIYMNNTCNITSLTEGYNVASYDASGSANSLPYYVEDGVVKCSLVEDGYREYLTMLAQWYSEGLMDADFISIEYDPFSSYMDGQITSDQMGVWPTSGEGIDKYTVDIVCMASPVQSSGDYQHITEMTLAPADDITSIAISTACENVEVAMAWADYWFSEDGILLYNYGLEDVDFTLDESGTPLFTDVIINNEFDLSASNYMRCRCAYGTLPSLMLRYRTAYLNSDLVNDAWAVWTSNLDGTMAISSNITMTTDESENEGYLASDILTYSNQMIAQFIIGDADIDTQWDSFVSTLISMGIEECIALEQAAYDRSVE